MRVGDARTGMAQYWPPLAVAKEPLRRIGTGGSPSKLLRSSACACMHVWYLDIAHLNAVRGHPYPQVP